MKSIFEIIDEKFDLKKEVIDIKNIFENEDLIAVESVLSMNLDTDYNMSLEKYIDKFNFKQWKYRGTCLSTKSFKEKIGIAELNKNSEDEKFIWYLEYVYNMLNIFSTINVFDTNAVDALKSTIILILDKINISLKEIEGRYILVEKNVTLDKVVSKVPNDMAYNFISYLNIKNTIVQKRDILKNIADYFEGVRGKYENSKVKFTRDLVNDTFYYFNNFNIRHNNLKGKKEKLGLKNIDNKELLKIYDKVFNNCLMLVLLEEYEDFENETKKYKEIIK
jgi:hypothetical protein